MWHKSFEWSSNSVSVPRVDEWIMRKCWREHLCMSSTFSVTKLNETCYPSRVNKFCKLFHKNPK